MKWRRWMRRRERQAKVFPSISHVATTGMTDHLQRQQRADTHSLRRKPLHCQISHEAEVSSTLCRYSLNLLRQ